MLINRLPEIDIPEDDPFKFDQLDRKPCANTFLSLVKLYSTTGCVIALNGEWGTGKTTFVRMLFQLLKKEQGHPLYFNAWENDYVSDPLIALLSELKELAPQSKKWDNVVANGGKILTGILTSAAKKIAKDKLGIDSDVISTGIDEVGKLLKDDIDEFSKQKTTFAEFRKALQCYISENTTKDIPVVFFVDELDRCNPHFSVLVLERIKHLFDIPNIIFVLSVNKKQLGYAIQGYYGSSNIDADNYLRRFIDIEYSLPRPDSNKFCQYLFNTYQFDKVFNHKERKQYSEFSSDADNFKKIATILMSASNLDLRTRDKIFTHTRLALMEFSANNYIVPDVFFLLCYLRFANPDLYHNIVVEKYTAQQLLDEIEEFIPLELLVMNENDYSWRQMTYTIASFTLMYTLNDNGIERTTIINRDDKTTTLKTKHMDEKTFSEALLWYHGKIHRGEIPLRLLTKKIELEQAIILSADSDN